MSEIAGQHIGVSGVDAEIAGRLREESARHWQLLLAIGVLSGVVGIYSILMPIVASISVTVLVGWAILIAGVIQLGHVLRRELAWTWMVAWRILVALLTALAGLWILILPWSGTITLTVVLVAWFWVIGVTRVLAWWRMRGVERSWIDGLNGAASIVLGFLIWVDLPSSATWAIGLLVGIELLFASSALVSAGLAGRQLARGR
jgi:uncharacterized membrane protein HdeD (DUF308 family)